jgi:hypothetical protein
LYLSLSKGLACGDNCSYWKCRNGARSYFTILSGTSGTASSLLNIPAVHVYGGDCLDVIVGKDINNRVIAYPAISTENSYISDVSLFGVGDGEVFLKAPKNTMTHNDRVIIARYIRNKRRNREDDGSSTWLTYKGWVRPRKTEGGQSRYFVIPEFSVTNGSYYTSYTINGVTYKFNDTDKYQYWRLTNQGKNLVNFIASNNVCHTGDGGEFQFVNKTLGLCIQRDGVQITDYLKFTIKQNEDGGLSFGRV